MSTVASVRQRSSHSKVRVTKEQIIADLSTRARHQRAAGLVLRLSTEGPTPAQRRTFVSSGPDRELIGLTSTRMSAVEGLLHGTPARRP